MSHIHSNTENIVNFDSKTRQPKETDFYTPEGENTPTGNPTYYGAQAVDIKFNVDDDGRVAFNGFTLKVEKREIVTIEPFTLFGIRFGKPTRGYNILWQATDTVGVTTYMVTNLPRARRDRAVRNLINAALNKARVIIPDELAMHILRGVLDDLNSIEMFLQAEFRRANESDESSAQAA